MVKMIVTDIDGTLLRYDQTVSDKTVEVLNKCKELGIKIVFASARPPRTTKYLMPEYFCIDAIINYNGALVYENSNIVYQKMLKNDAIENILNVVHNKIIEPKVCFEINDAHYSNFDVTDTFGKIPYQLIDLKDFKTDTAYKIILCNMKNENKTEILENLPENCTCMVTDGDQLFQIMDRNVSKFNAIKFIIDKYGIGTDDIMCFGDDCNDIEMLSNCGISVAMDNAVPQIKKIAKYITNSNDNDGVALFIENYLNLK